MPDVIMPKMGDAMEEGTILRWIKSEGDEVSEGDVLAEIETDKVNLELEAEDAGTLAQLVASEGESIAVGEPIAFIQGEGEEVPERASGGGEQQTEAAESEDDAGSGGGETSTATEERPQSEEQPQSDAPAQANGHVRASPIVRRLARENEVDLAQVTGSGPQGRIVERDIRSFIESGGAQSVAQQSSAQQSSDGAAEQPEPQQVSTSSPAAATGAQAPELPAPTRAPGAEVREPSRMQRVVAERMAQSKQQVPHFYATSEIRMDELMALRKQLNERLAEDEIKLSVNDFVMKACALALRNFPTLNALYTNEGVELHASVDMAMAVALDDGLITPVVRDCARKGLSEISAEAKDLAGRARDGKLKPDEYQGGTFTVSNMGMFGVESFSAIINQPQAAIVAVSSIIKRPMFDDDGNVVPASLMKLTLSADHRVSNGAEGALYLAEVRKLMENPMLLMV